MAPTVPSFFAFGSIYFSFFQFAITLACKAVTPYISVCICNCCFPAILKWHFGFTMTVFPGTIIVSAKVEPSLMIVNLTHKHGIASHVTDQFMLSKTVRIWSVHHHINGMFSADLIHVHSYFSTMAFAENIILKMGTSNVSTSDIHQMSPYCLKPLS